MLDVQGVVFRWFIRIWRGRKVSVYNSKTSPFVSEPSGDHLRRFHCRGGPSGWAWCTMKATGRPLVTPTRSLLLNLFFAERIRTLARKLVCRRCLHTLQSNVWVSQKIGELSAVRTRHRRIPPCGFWHEEARRRRGPTVQTRPLATVQEGRWFQLPGLDRTKSCVHH
jgi:hypothetical protein